MHSSNVATGSQLQAKRKAAALNLFHDLQTLEGFMSSWSYNLVQDAPRLHRGGPTGRTEKLLLAVKTPGAVKHFACLLLE